MNANRRRREHRIGQFHAKDKLLQSRVSLRDRVGLATRLGTIATPPACQANQHGLAGPRPHNPLDGIRNAMKNTHEAVS
jgi:hypothetical protein